MTILDILICSLLTFAVWGIFRALAGVHEVIPGVNEPPQNGWHPPDPEASGAPTPIRGVIVASILTVGFWSLIYLGAHTML